MSDGANSVAVQDDLGFRPAAPQVRASAADDDLGFRAAQPARSAPAASSGDDLGFRPSAPAAQPTRTYSLADLGTPSRTALGPGVSSQVEKPYTAVPGVFGEPELSEASKQRIARERIDQGWKIKAAPSGVGPWLENLEADIRYGTGYTAPGRALHAMGAEGLDVGKPPAVGETLGGPFIGPVRAVRGLKQALGPYAGEPADVQSEVRGLNEALRGTMQTVAPVAAATNPGFIPTIAPYAVGGNLAESGLRKIGVPPEEAELASNVALLGGGMAHAGIAEPRAPFGGVYEGGATEPVVKGDTVPDFLKGITDKTGAAVENARRLERINAPVEIPRTPETTAPPPILSRPTPRTPMEELSAQAAEARRPQEFRQQLTREISDQIISRLRDEGLLEPPKTNVVDRRAVRPEDVEPYQPPRTFIGRETGPAAVVPRGENLLRQMDAERPPRMSQQDIELGFRPAEAPRPEGTTSRGDLELGFRPAESRKMLPAANADDIEGARQVQERYNAELANMRARVPLKPREPVPIAAPADIALDSRRVGNLFAGRMGNPIERQFTMDLWHWMLDRKGAEPEPPANVGKQRAGIIRDRLAEISQGQIGGRVPNPKAVFPQDVLDEALAMMGHTHDYLSQQEKPGRYFADMGDETSLTGRGAKLPITVVRSQRGQFPWFANLKEGPGDLEKALKRGEGPGYDRLLTSAAEHIARTREELRAASLSVEPNLAQLADQVRDIDPDLANLLRDASEGKISQWTETKRELLDKISEGISNARSAIEFSRAVDEVAQEERAGNVSESPEGRPETRAPGGPAGQGTAPPASPELASSEVSPPAATRRLIGASVAGPPRIGEGILPGLEGAVAEQGRAAGIEQGRRLGEEAARPLGSIESAAGTMERESPLFRGTEASSQREMYDQPPVTGHLRPEPESDPERIALLAKLRELEQAAARREQVTPQARTNNADALRRAAESLTTQIEAKKNPAISNQNPTQRRARIADSMYREAESMEKVQRTLHGMADAADAGQLPESLTGVRSRALIEDLLRRDKPPRALLRARDIRDLIEKTKTHSGVGASRAVLSRTLGRGDYPELHGSDEIGAAEALMTVAEQRGLGTKYMRAELTDYKRAAAAGIETPDKWAEARKAVLEYAGKEQPRGVEKQIKDAERELIGNKIPGYFPTPKTLANRLVEMADINPGDKVLEPSAGNGSIADAIRQKAPDAKLDTVEQQDRLRKILELKGYNIAGRDFLDMKPEPLYDRIVMNPPFERGADASHVEHAFKFLKPGGRLVAIMSEGTFFRETQVERGFRDWLESVGGESEKLPEASFTGKEAQRQTGTATRVVTIEKPPERDEAGFATLDLMRDVLSGRLPKEAWQQFVAEPFIEKGLGIGDKYAKVREADPDVAAGLHLLDNAPAYFRAKTAQTIHDIIGGLSRDQERLFTLMSDADSRENLRANHPQEFRQATTDPAIQEALRKYRPIEQQLTTARERMGGATLDRDYLRRVYDQHVSGISQAEAPGTSERATTAFDRVIQPQRLGNMSREATAEYHYQHGLHEFGPAFGTKFLATNLRGLEDQVARNFIAKATELKPGAPEPRFITYQGQKYYRPDIARDMREAGQKNAQAYDRYDPTAGVKYPQQGTSRFLGPRDVVRALNDYSAGQGQGPGAVRRFLQEQVIGYGFGLPHVANILRRVTQSAPMGAANPEAWARAWKVAVGKELRERGMQGLDDPTFDRLLRQGAITTGEMANLKQYWGGNLNPANWARTLAKVGHKLIFEPGSFGGLGGVDQRARIYIADLVKSQNPSLTDEQIARAVNTQLGDYNRANWTDRQKTLSKFMLFPGWDTSSMRWVIQHPLKTTVPPALLIWTANQILNRYGQNRPDDASDIQNIHWGDRSIGVTLLRESMARNLMRPAFNYAQSRIRGESGQRAIGEAARGVTQGAGGLVGTLRPDITAGIDLAMNRQSPFGGQELVSRDDYNLPGRILPNRALEKQAALVVRHAVPALDRMLGSDQEIDFKAFAGSNVGLPNYKSGAEQRLKRNTAETMEVSQTLSRLAKTDQGMARQFIQDPYNAAYALFRNEFSEMSKTLKRMDDAKETVTSAKNLSADEKRERLAQIDRSRQNLLRNADGLDRLLFEHKQGNRARPTMPGKPIRPPLDVPSAVR